MAWSWDQITAVSSLVGVVGGLVSVYFLILEVRRNAKATEGATVQSLMDAEIVVFDLLANSAALYLKGIDDVSLLTNEEKFQFDKLISAQMSLYYSAYVQWNGKLISDDMWHAFLASLHDYLQKPGFRAAWKATEAVYPKLFRDLANAPLHRMVS